MSAATATILTAVAIGASAGGSIYSATKQSSAAKESAKLQATAADKALTYEKERDVYARGTESNRYGQMMRQNAPLVQSGHAANARMADLLGLPSQPTESTAHDVQPGMVAGQASGGQMVQLRAPDGTMKSVPPEHVAHFVRHGAQRV